MKKHLCQVKCAELGRAPCLPVRSDDPLLQMICCCDPSQGGSRKKQLYTLFLLQWSKQGTEHCFGPKSTILPVQKHVEGRDVKADKLEMMSKN